ncbi:MAG: type III secretion system inner rod subunit SctI [Janthinobacterium lividum]
MLTISSGNMNAGGAPGTTAGSGADTPFVSAAHDVSAASAAHEAARFAQALTREQGAHDTRDDRPGIEGGPGQGVGQRRERGTVAPREPTHAWRDGLRDAAAMLDRDWTAATGLAAAPMHAGRWGPADMLALQGRMLQVSLQMDLASKLVQKSTQAVDQLVRIQ